MLKISRKIKLAIRKFFFTKGLLLRRMDSNKKLLEFINRFREKYISIDLIRVGGGADGGYLVPNNLEELKYCFSPGVDCTADFESELSKKYNIKSFLADASVKSPPIEDRNIEFIPKFLGSTTKKEFITLKDWINISIGEEDGKKILQMDIEGGEYDVLIHEDSSVIASFSYLVIEFHDLEKIFNSDFLMVLSSIFEKIYKNFSICHVHPNNCSGIASLKGISVPRVMEVTFIRNDLAPNLKNNNPITLPHELDTPNVHGTPDIEMPEIWWKD